MARRQDFPAFAGRRSAAKTEAGRQIAEAADLVTDFTNQSALSALDAALAATAGATNEEAAAAFRETAETVAQQTEMLYAEVLRFLTQPPD